MGQHLIQQNDNKVRSKKINTGKVKGQNLTKQSADDRTDDPVTLVKQVDEKPGLVVFSLRIFILQLQRRNRFHPTEKNHVELRLHFFEGFNKTTDRKNMAAVVKSVVTATVSGEAAEASSGHKDKLHGAGIKKRLMQKPI